MVFKLGSQGDGVRSIQEMLTYLGYGYKLRNDDGSFEFEPLKNTGDFDAKTESAILDFQSSMGILRDGKAGPITLKRLQEEYSRRVLELTSHFIGEEVQHDGGIPQRYFLQRCKADKYKEGYGLVALRNDAATAYNLVYEEVHKLGGILTSSGGIRSLDTPVTAGRSATSMHYLGRALDLYIYSGMMNPATDPYVIQRIEERTYIVYARCSLQNNPNAQLPARFSISNAITYNNRITGTTAPEDHYINLTEIFTKNDLKPIRARRGFEDDRSMMSGEWWHFQYEKGLIRGVTSYGSELEKLYSLSVLETSPPWQYRNLMYGIEWN